MPFLYHTEAVLELGLEKSPDSGLEENLLPVQVLDQKPATGQGNPMPFVGLDPPFPQCPRHVPEHGTAVETLAIPFHRPELQRHRAPFESWFSDSKKSLYPVRFSTYGIAGY